VHYFSQLGIVRVTGTQLLVLEKLVAIGITCLFIYINYRGASETGTAGTLFTLGQTVTLVFIALVGIGTAFRDPGRLANFQPFLPHGWSKLLVTMGFTYVAFEGFEVIAQTGDEAIDPRRNLPKAMLYSICIVVFTYVGVAFASIVAVKDVGEPAWMWIGSHGAKGFGQAVSRLFPSVGSLLVTITVIFASTSALNATIYSATRASYALGRDRMLPAAFSRLSTKRRTPYVALLFTAGLMITVAAFLPVIDVASSASMMFLFLFFLVNLCVLRIRRHMGDELTYGFVMPFFPFLPIAAIVIQAVLAVWLIHMSLIAWIVGPAWIVSGIGIYHAYSKHRAIRTQDEIVVLQEEPIPDKEGYRILVAVGNPANAVPLVRHCYRFCEAKDAPEVEVLHMVPVPSQVPLSDASKYALAGEESIVEAMLYIAPRFSFGSTMRYCRNIARGIISAAAERTFALETASIFVEREGGCIVVFHVASPGKPTQDVETFLDETVPSFGGSRALFESKYTISRERLKALLDEADRYDLVVIGAAKEGLFQRMVMGSLPEEFARRCEKPLIMVKARHPIKSFVMQWM
jgi:amino acid transporter